MPLGGGLCGGDCWNESCNGIVPRVTSECVLELLLLSVLVCVEFKIEQQLFNDYKFYEKIKIFKKNQEYREKFSF